MNDNIRATHFWVATKWLRSVV